MFHFPQQQAEPVHYFCGHSLGLQPLATKHYVNEELEKWATQGVEGHFEEPRPWLSYHTLLKPGLAQLCGAKETEVVGYGSLSSNLHFLLASFYRPTKKRNKVLSEETNFPSDRFALESHVQFQGISPKEALIWIPKDAHYCYSTEQIIALIRQHRDELALVFLSSVNFLSGQVLDIPAIVKVAKEYGILVGLDLAHAIGNTPLNLHEDGVDFAVWCSYKYLNGGPGAAGGYFVHERHFPKEGKEIPILAGWWGNKEESRFLIGNEFSPIENADAWQHSNANVLSLAAIRASLDLFLKEDISVLYQKSLKQTDWAWDMVNNYKKCRVLTPRNERGNMLSIQLKEENQGLLAKLKEKKMWVDEREPRIVRFSFNPLYNTEKEWEQFLIELGKVL